MGYTLLHRFIGGNMSLHLFSVTVTMKSQVDRRCSRCRQQCWEWSEMNGEENRGWISEGLDLTHTSCRVQATTIEAIDHLQCHIEVLMLV